MPILMLFYPVVSKNPLFKLEARYISLGLFCFLFVCSLINIKDTLSAVNQSTDGSKEWPILYCTGRQGGWAELGLWCGHESNRQTCGEGPTYGCIRMYTFIIWLPRIPLRAGTSSLLVVLWQHQTNHLSLNPNFNKFLQNTQIALIKFEVVFSKECDMAMAIPDVPVAPAVPPEPIELCEELDVCMYSSNQKKNSRTVLKVRSVPAVILSLYFYCTFVVLLPYYK